MIRARESKSAPVGVLSKVLRLLETLGSSSGGLHLNEISQKAAINKSTAYRFLAHLEWEGYLYRDETGAYVVGPRLVRLGSAANYQTALKKISRPVLEELWKSTGETVNLGVLDGQGVVYLDVLQSPHPFRMASPVGMWRPLYCTAMGKALAAHLPSSERDRLLTSLRLERLTPNSLTRLSQLRTELELVRRNGYALDNEEATLGARCIAAPILTQEGEAPAAISVAGPVTRIGKDKITDYATAVLAAARSISARLDPCSYGAKEALKNQAIGSIPQER
jgi:DNA-binding IclR family transcriptional regulator